MKKAILPLLIGLAPILCQAQEPPKGSNQIIVKGITFGQVKSALLDSGYYIDQQNEQDGTIITKETVKDDYKMFGQKTDRFVIILYIRIKDSTATITGKMAWNYIQPRQWTEIEYWKAKGSVLHYLFGVMDNFARDLGKDVSYAKL